VEKAMDPPRDLLSQFPFLSDPTLSDELKKFLIEKSIQKETAAWSNQLEIRKWRWSTPLAIALTGAITIGANFAVNYWMAQQKQVLEVASAEADAKRRTISNEREFEYKIVERELGQEKSEAERAQVLLFLVRAGVLNGLNVTELKSMAEAALRKEGKEPSVIGIPSLGLDDNNSQCGPANKNTSVANFGSIELVIESCVAKSDTQYRYYYRLWNSGSEALTQLSWPDLNLRVNRMAPNTRFSVYRVGRAPSKLVTTSIAAGEGLEAKFSAIIPTERPTSPLSFEGTR
jgi:hypothetical protein